MTSSCPYCGAALKLKYCTFCGRHSNVNQVGNIRATARNTEATQRMENPLDEKKLRIAQIISWLKKLSKIILVIFIATVLAMVLLSAFNSHEKERLRKTTHSAKHPT